MASLSAEFDRLAIRSPWMASFTIEGQEYGSGLNHAFDVRPPDFFRHFPNAARILELGACQGGGTFQLARHPGLREIIAIEGRAFNLEKAEFVRKLLGVGNVRFLLGNLETFDFAPLGKFDAVYCVGVLYHLPKPWELLTKLAKVADYLYINTHYSPHNEIAMSLSGYEGKRWNEFGYDDPLSGMSAWSFWPTLRSLADMLLRSGFVPEILETDTIGLGQSPHGTTIIARRQAVLGPDESARLMRQFQRILMSLPRGAGALSAAKKSWWRRILCGSWRHRLARIPR